MHRVAETIKVAAVFTPGTSVRPVWFEWRRRKHSVTEMSYVWKDRVGDQLRLHFAVSDGCDLFQLTYHAGNQSWTLEGVEEKLSADAYHPPY